MKKIIALLISVIMILGIMPLNAFAAEVISTVKISDITVPVAGQKPDYVATYGSGYNFTTQFDGTNTNYGVAWVDVTDGQKPMTSDDVFVAGHVYRVAVIIVAQSEYSFSKSDNYTSTVSGSINNKKGNVYVISGYNAGDYIGVTYTFAACTYNIISFVAVTDLDVPASGGKFDFTASTAADSYFVNSISWKDVTANKTINEYDVATPGHTYEVEIWLRVNDGYKLKVDSDDCPDVTAKIGAYNATVIPAVSDMVVGITDSYIVPDDITSVSVSGIDAPVTGSTADTTAICGSGYQITKIEWFDTTGEYKDHIRDITVFESERNYTVEVTLTVIGNYRFRTDDIGAIDVSGTINGNDAIEYSDYSNTVAVIGYEFPATEKPVPSVIDEVYVNGIDAPVAGSAVDKDADCGEGYEITEIVWVDTTDEYADYVYGIETFESGRKYTVQITLKTEDEYEFNVVDGYTEVTGTLDGNKAIVYGSHSETEISIGYEFPAVTEPEHTHIYTPVVISPTCKDKGYTTHTCECGDNYVDTYTDITDSHTPVVIPGKPATTTETGLTDGKKCSVCDKELEAQTEIPKIIEDHKHTPGDWVVITPAEFGVEGKEEKKCTGCGKVLEERAIPALTNPDADIMPGDVNKDGKITAADARLALRISAKLETATDYQNKVADMNKDGKITAADARKILRKSAKLE